MSYIFHIFFFTLLFRKTKSAVWSACWFKSICISYGFFYRLRCFGWFSLHFFSYMIFIRWRPFLLDCIIVCFLNVLCYINVRCVPFFTLILLLLNLTIYPQKKRASNVSWWRIKLIKIMYGDFLSSPFHFPLQLLTRFRTDSERVL